MTNPDHGRPVWASADPQQVHQEALSLIVLVVGQHDGTQTQGLSVVRESFEAPRPQPAAFPGVRAVSAKPIAHRQQT